MDKRLDTDRNIWLATVRPDGRPHLVPIWFVWIREKIFISTPAKSVKARNLQSNPKISIALENGSDPLIGEGDSIVIPTPYPADVVDAFKAKYGWDITTLRTHRPIP